MHILTLAAVVVITLTTLAATGVLSTIGGDISEPYSVSNFRCARKHGWDFLIVRGWCSYGGGDPNVHTSLNNAKAAGIPYRDFYMFPCGTKSAAKQVREAVAHVGKGNFGEMWFDIETNPSPGCAWSGNKEHNCQWLKDAIAEGHKIGLHMGVYSSDYEWGSVMGGCTAGSDAGLPQWYADYDNSASWSGLHNWGGWTKPAMKQYSDHANVPCGINADADWYP